MLLPLSLVSVVGGRSSVVGAERPPYQRNARSVSEVVAAGCVDDGEVGRATGDEAPNILPSQSCCAAGRCRGQCFVDGHVHVAYRQAMQNDMEVV